MQIKNLFNKPIDRGIRGVIKVEQDDESLIKQELEEYVVTKELTKNFDRFFSFYAGSRVDIPAVWISGFFGSGKSHFLKILSYILSGKEVSGKKAIDYFVDDKKISDAMILANMKRASNTKKDVILFDISKKSNVTTNKEKEPILLTFLRAFNEKTGYSGSNFFLADLERQLDEKNQLNAFRDKFKELTSSDWSEAHYDFSFIQDDVVDTLSEIGFMSVESARNWCEKATGDYSMSVEDFTRLLKKYLSRKSEEYRVIFMVDEVGQYIGDNSKDMLSLQAIVEKLSDVCKDRVWVICTGQQDIDSITKVVGNDLSKILGRFERISLSSSDVDEVIKKRILDKTPTAKESLKMYYESKASEIKNKVSFKNCAEMKLYANADDFSDCYPFIPYQFNLLGQSLTAIREHSSSGKHMSDAERTLLAITQESAISIMNENEGVFLPFSSFYAPIEKHIDSSHSTVITNASKNGQLQPIDVDILKTLFMIKYVKSIVATLDNITSLMITNVEEDLLGLKKKVEEGLARLIKQMVVQKQLLNGIDIFVFLTNEEQEIAREIENTQVESSEIVAKLSDILFNDIYRNTKYQYDVKHNYPFNKIFDGRFFGGVQNCEIGVKVISPLSEASSDESYMMSSSTEKNVFVLLPSLYPYYDEIRVALKIEKYITKNMNTSTTYFAEVRSAKQKEATDRKSRAKTFLEEAVKEAKIFVNGSVFDSSAKEPAQKIDAGIRKLFETVYNKLQYIEQSFDSAAIVKLFSVTNQLTVNNSMLANKNARDEVLDYIKQNTIRHVKTSIKTIKERYGKAPYGFNDEDTEWIIAALFKSGDISMTMNNENITLTNRSADELYRYFTKKEYTDKILLEKREKVSEMQKKDVKEVMQALFGMAYTLTEEDVIMLDFAKKTLSFLYGLKDIEMKYVTEPRYPGKKVIDEIKTILQTLAGIQNPIEFFRMTSNRKDELLDLIAEYDSVKEFFKGTQVSYFTKALKSIDMFNGSRNYINDTFIISKVDEMKAIISRTNPYSEIYRLPDIVKDFEDKYCAVLDSYMEPVLDEIKDTYAQVNKEYKNSELDLPWLKKGIDTAFQSLSKRAESSVDIAVLYGMKLEVSVLKDNLKTKILDEKKKADELQRIKEEEDKKQQGDDTPVVVPAPPVKAVKHTKVISMKTVAAGQSWNLETEADVDKMMTEIKARVMQQLSADEIIKIEV